MLHASATVRTHAHPALRPDLAVVLLQLPRLVRDLQILGSVERCWRRVAQREGDA